MINKYFLSFFLFFFFYKCTYCQLIVQLAQLLQFFLNMLLNTDIQKEAKPNVGVLTTTITGVLLMTGVFTVSALN